MPLENLFTETWETTNGFKDIDIKSLVENPKRLLVFRLCAGLSQEKLIQLLNQKDPRFLRKLERGEVETVGVDTAENILKVLMPLIKPLSVSELKIASSMFTTMHNASLMGLKLEDEIEELLKKNSINFVKFRILKGTANHKPDFIIPDEKRPKIVVEAKFSNGRKSILKAKEVAFTSIDLKNRFKDIVFILFIKGRWDNTAKMLLNRWVDFVVENDLDELIGIINETLKSNSV